MLERRYRRLIACYPEAYRQVSGDEMLGVALAGTRPGQRWPAPGEVRSLILGGARVRVAAGLAGLRAPAWRDAAEAFVFLATALLAGIFGRTLDGQLLPLINGEIVRHHLLELVLVTAWPLTGIAVTMRWRWAAGVGAAVNLAGAGFVVADEARRYPWAIVNAWWVIILMITAALATVPWLVSPRRARWVLPRATMAVISCLMTLLAATPLLAAAFNAVMPAQGGFIVSGVRQGFFGGFVNYGLAAAALLGLLAGVTRLSPAVRRRVLILVIPALAAWALVEWEFGGFIASRPWFPPPVPLTVPQWAVLAAVPVLGLIAGMTWLGRHERMLRRRTTPPTAAP